MDKRYGNKLPSEKKVIDYERLQPLIQSVYAEIKEFSKKKPDGALNTLKVKMINRALKQIKDFLSDEPNIDFLELLDEEVIPSNSDAVLVVSQFLAVISQFREKYYGYDSDRGVHRWFTDENPPLNYDDSDDYDEEEDEEDEEAE